ncbi:MAG TPA: endonuclease [Bacteroidales bacterium]|nr:endonuclease [Bacteroidales bacterium]
MYYVYALYSVKYKKIYIGFTSNLEQRLNAHNHPLNKGYTRKYKPWEILYSESHDEKQSAMRREKQLKTAQGRKFIKSLLPG